MLYRVADDVVDELSRWSARVPGRARMSIARVIVTPMTNCGQSLRAGRKG